jgi:hypothetical protein
LATNTNKRNPLTLDDCRILAEQIPGAVFHEIPLEEGAAVVYLKDFFNTEGVSQDLMVEEMQRVKPKYIDRYMQNRGPTRTNHKNKRWNTNVTDRLNSNEENVYAKHKELTLQRDKNNKNNKKYIPKLESSEIPFWGLPAFVAARKKIERCGKFLPSDMREFGNQRNNLDNLVCELNFYFGRPLKPGGIGLHGDVERNLVFGGSIGTADRFVEWILYQKNRPVVDKSTGKINVYRVRLRPGDGYIMSQYASGFNWDKPAGITIRHRAGSRDFLYKNPDSKVKLDGTTKVFTKDFKTDRDNKYFNTIDVNPDDREKKKKKTTKSKATKLKAAKKVVKKKRKKRTTKTT